jgi:hypothetical protein
LGRAAGRRFGDDAASGESTLNKNVERMVQLASNALQERYSKLHVIEKKKSPRAASNASR